MTDEDVSGVVVSNEENSEIIGKENSAKMCSACGAILEDTQLFCSNCGAPRNQKVQCKKCGANMQSGQEFCPICGTKQDSVKIDRRKGKTVIIGAVIVAIVIGVAILASTFLRNGGREKTANFREMFPDLTITSYTEIGEDGQYLKIDTNPDDTDEDDFGISEYLTMNSALDAIEQVNSDLGFSSALLEKMKKTTAIQGVQSDSNEKYVVTWSYHPDNGLEVIYEIK